MSDWLKNFEESSGEIRLSEYVDRNEATWRQANVDFLNKLLTLTGQKAGVDFFNGDHSQDVSVLYERIRGILLDNYQTQLYAALKELGGDPESFEREFIFGTMLSVIRKRSNADYLINLMKNRGILKGYSFIDGQYSFDTVRYGLVNFFTAESRYPQAENIFKAPDLLNSCHKYAEQFMKIYQGVEIVTATLNKDINLRYYHSFAVDGENVVDVSNGIVMERSWYYYLSGVAEINRLTYKAFLETKDISLPYDESGSLFELLRMAAYKQIRG